MLSGIDGLAKIAEYDEACAETDLTMLCIPMLTATATSPDESHLVASPCSYPSIKAVVAHVRFAVLEPLHTDGPFAHVKVVLKVVGIPLQAQNDNMHKST